MRQDEMLERVVIGLHAEIDLDPGWWWSHGLKYGTFEYWKAYEKAMESEAKDLNEFIRDHRSRDGYGISIVREHKMICKFCGHEYPDEYNGILDCCDKAIDLEQENIKSLVNEEP